MYAFEVEAAIVASDDVEKVQTKPEKGKSLTCWPRGAIYPASDIASSFTTSNPNGHG
jgi:hypothetical protein